MEFGSKYFYYNPHEEEKEHFETVELQKTIKEIRNDHYSKNDDGETCLLDILDTAGQEEYSSMRDQYMRSGDCFMICYSITSRSSFEEVEAMLNQVSRILVKNNNFINFTFFFLLIL